MSFVSLDENAAEDLALREGARIKKVYYVDKKADRNKAFLCIRERELKSGELELVFSNFKL